MDYVRDGYRVFSKKGRMEGYGLNSFRVGGWGRWK